MESVNQFENELNGIQECRPPVSRAKMASITKLAMKSHKYYKHIVMLVEKFISKSRLEYKVPGLYVIDSIMRQSRHQFGAKDCFGPRFTKNFEKTFLHLFQCPEEDKPKIVRVLNLWQKNEVFPSDVIQPLLALASTDVIHGKPRHKPERNRDKPHPPLSDGASVVKTEDEPDNHPNLDLTTATTIIQQQQEQISALLQQQQQLQTQATSLLAPALSNVLGQQQPPGGVQQLEALSSLLQQTQQLHRLQAIQQRLANGDDEDGAVGGAIPAQITNVESIAHNTQPQPPLFNEAVLDDFDYSDEEDTMDRASRVARQKEREVITKPPVPLMADNDPGSPAHSSPLRQEPLEPLFPKQDVAPFVSDSLPPFQTLSSETHPYPSEMGGNNPPMPSSSAPPPNHPAYPHQHHNTHSQNRPTLSQIPPGPMEWSRQLPPPLPPHYPPPPRSPSPRRRQSRFSSPPPILGRRSPSPPPHHRPWRERDRERSRWSSPPRQRSRSPPPHMRRRSHERSRSPPHSRWHRINTPPENQERRRKGVPFPRNEHMTVCTTTLWVGHLSKITTTDTVKEAFEDFGQIKSVELVQARGCAYLVMMHRNDAIRALNSLRDLKLGGTTCKLAWAPGRGVKGAGLKAFWDQEVGSSYIPWSFIKTQTDVDTMAAGAWIDIATIPPGLKEPPAEEEMIDEESETTAVSSAQVDALQPSMRNVLLQSVPPVQNLPPQPPVPSFPQLMNPTATFQAPGEIIPHFPPRGVPISQPLSQMPPFSQPNGVPFHSNIRPPIGTEPQSGMLPQQQMHRPPPTMGGVPHSMAAHIGGAPQQPTMHSMGGGPQYTQVPMHRPLMMTTMPQMPHHMQTQTTPQRLMPSPTSPFLPQIGVPQPPLVGSTAHTGRPIRPLLPPHMGDGPHSGHPMVPHTSEGPRSSFAPHTMSDTYRTPLVPHMGDGPQPPFAPHVGSMLRPSMVPFMGQRPPISQQMGEFNLQHLPHPPPMSSQAELRPLMISLIQPHVETETEPLAKGEGEDIQTIMDESTEPIPMDEEQNEPDSPTTIQTPNITEEPDQPEEPREPLLDDKPPMGEEPLNQLSEDAPIPTNEPHELLPIAPLMGEEPNKPPTVPPQTNEVSPQVQEPLLIAPPTGNEPNLTSEDKEGENVDKSTPNNAIKLSPSHEPFANFSNTPLDAKPHVPLETIPQPDQDGAPLDANPQPHQDNSGPPVGIDDMYITTDEEDLKMATSPTDDSDYL